MCASEGVGVSRGFPSFFDTWYLTLENMASTIFEASLYSETPETLVGWLVVLGLTAL